MKCNNLKIADDGNLLIKANNPAQIHKKFSTERSDGVKNGKLNELAEKHQ